ncbi:MAG: hypothetical protein K6G88_06715, partial [Lachnospiraceae bacterium]|nr:hypothetical protein [Lachnospiraceae bacterium]
MQKFQFKSITFELSEPEQNYALESQKNSKFQQEAVIQFGKCYDNYASMDEAMKKISEDLANIILATSEKYISEWVKKGYYDIDSNIFMSNYASKYITDSLYIEDAYYEVEEKYTDIVMTQEQKEEYRRLRKESRGRWVGGGFGFDGAIRGATTAGAMNLVTGMGHSLVNAVGNIAGSISASIKKDKLYHESKEIFIDALKKDIVYLKFANMAFSSEKLGTKYSFPSEEKCERANAIINNISKNSIKEPELTPLIKQLFSLNPYNEALYELLLSLYGDSDKYLASIADYFGKHTELTNMKLNNIKKVYEQKPKSTWQECRNLEEEMKQLSKYYGISDVNYTTDLIESIHKKYEELYIKASTYNNILYASPEEAESVKKEEAAVNEIKKNIVDTDYSSLEEALSKINMINSSFYKDKSKDIESIKSKLSNIEKRKINAIFSKADAYDMKSLQDALEAIRVFPNHYYDKKEDLKRIQSKIDNFDSDSKKFLNYTFDSTDEAKKAKKIYEDSLALISCEKYEEAINKINECPIPKVKSAMQSKIQNNARKKLESTISHAKKFKNNNFTPNISLKETILWILAIEVIGFIVSHFISFVPIIAVILDVLVIIGYIISLNDLKNEKAKAQAAYDKIEKLNSIGYNFTLD